MKNKGIYLILDNIRSAHNVGSMFRTADAAGVKKIYLCGYTPIPGLNSKHEAPTRNDFVIAKSGGRNPKQIKKLKLKIDTNDKIAKVALGAEKTVPWEHVSQTWRCLRQLKNQTLKIKIIGLERFGKLTASKLKSKNIFNYSPSTSRSPLTTIALVVGNEVRGLSRKILKHCDDIVEIPMYGKKESLNVSVATGVALYRMKELIDINKKSAARRRGLTTDKYR